MSTDSARNHGRAYFRQGLAGRSTHRRRAPFRWFAQVGLTSWIVATSPILCPSTQFARAQEDIAATTPAESTQRDQKFVGPIHRLTTSAKTMQDYTVIIDRCTETMAQAELPGADLKYLQQLASWAYNRRCESRLEEAEYYRDAGLQPQATGAVDQALSDAIQSLELDPTRWRAWLNRGLLLAQAGMLDDALADFQRAAELQPTSTAGWYNAGEAQAALRRPADAVACYDRALAIDPGDLQALTGRGLARLQLNQPEQALCDFDLVLKWMPQNPATLINRGDAHLALRQWREAYSDYEAAAKLSESAASCQRAAWLMATCPDPEYFRPATAKQLAERAVELGEPTCAVWETLAAAHAALGAFDQAMEVQQRAVELADEPAASECRQRLEQYAQHQPLQR